MHRFNFVADLSTLVDKSPWDGADASTLNAGRADVDSGERYIDYNYWRNQPRVDRPDRALCRSRTRRRMRLPSPAAPPMRSARALWPIGPLPCLPVCSLSLCRVCLPTTYLLSMYGTIMCNMCACARELQQALSRKG